MSVEAVLIHLYLRFCQNMGHNRSMEVQLMTTPIFESNGLSAATAMLEAYREELLRNGRDAAAMQLKGLEIFTLSGAQCALATIRGIKDGGELKQYVVSAIEQSISNYERSTSQAEAS
jgi:hypothetical protein